MHRRQSSFKFKFFEFTVLTAIFLLNSSFIGPVLADGESVENAMAAPAPGDTGDSVSDFAKTLTPAAADASAPALDQTIPQTATPAEAPALAPEAPNSVQSPTPAPVADLVMQAPQMAIDPVLASSYSNRLGKMEEIAFGASYAEHELNDRIDHLEEEIFKVKNAGSPDARISKLESKVFGQSAFAGGSQAPKGAGYLPFTPGPAPGPSTETPIASIGGVSTAPVYSGGNAPPVIIPAAPANQPPPNQPAQTPQLPQMTHYQTQAPYQPQSPPYAVQPYQGTPPYSGNNYYPNNQSYGTQRPPVNAGSYSYAPAYGSPNYQQYPTSHAPTQTPSYQYGSGTQPYSGQPYQQYLPYRPAQIQQPSMPQQLYTQPYQQFPSSQYPQSSYPPAQYPLTQYPPAQYLQPGTQTLTPQDLTPQPVQPPSSKNSAACEKVASAIPQSAKDGDYFTNIRHFAGNTSMHWQTFPVLVHLPKDSPDSWRRALDGDLKKWGQYVPMSIAKGDEKAKIDVQFVNKLPAKILGVTRINGSAEDLKVTIFVLRPTFYPSEIPENVLQHVFAHELGHALGLLGHSTNSIDVMYIRDDKQDKPTKSTKADSSASGDKVNTQFGSDKPSGRDLNTLKKLYMSAPLPSGFKLEQPLEYSTRILDILDI